MKTLAAEIISKDKKQIIGIFYSEENCKPVWGYKNADSNELHTGTGGFNKTIREACEHFNIESYEIDYKI
jgi:hypothetical protein